MAQLQSTSVTGNLSTTGVFSASTDINLTRSDTTPALVFTAQNGLRWIFSGGGNYWQVDLAVNSSGLLTMGGQPVATRNWVQGLGYVTGGPYLPTAGGTLTGVLTISTTEDGKLVLRAPAGDTSQWNYINFVGTDGVRDAYFGTDGSGNPQWWRDDNNVNITLGSNVNIGGGGIVLTAADADVRTNRGRFQVYNNAGTGNLGYRIRTDDNGGWRWQFVDGSNGEYFGVSYPGGVVSFLPSSGTIASRGGFSDFIGYNPSYGSYIGGGAGNAGNYLYAGGFFWDGGTIRTLWHSGNLTNLNQLANGPGYVTGGPYLPLSGGTVTGRTNIGTGGSTAGGLLNISGASNNQVNISANSSWGLLIGYGDGNISGNYHGTNHAAIINVQNAPLHLGTNNTSLFRITSTGSNTDVSFTVNRDLGTNDYTNTGQHNLQLRIRKASLDGGCAPRTLELGVLDNGTGIIQANHCGVGYNTLALNPVAGAVTINGNTVWHQGNLTNLNQLSNGPGYVTGGPYLALSGGSMTGNISFGSSGAGLTWAANTDGASITFESTGDGASGGRALSNLLIALTDNGDEGLRVTTTGSELLYVNINQFQYRGNNVWHAGNLTNLNQLTNGPGYVTGGPYLPLSGGTLSGTLGLPNAALISVNNEPDVWGARFRTTASTPNLGSQLKNIIWTGGGTVEGFAVSGSGTGGAAFEVRNDGIVWARSQMRAPIFFDSDNTGFYLDPAGYSNLRAVGIDGYTQFGITLADPGANFGNYRRFVRVWPTSGGARIMSFKITISGTWNWSPVFGLISADVSFYFDGSSLHSSSTTITSATGPAQSNLNIGAPVIENGFVSVPVFIINSNPVHVKIEGAPSFDWNNVSVSSAQSVSFPGAAVVSVPGSMTVGGSTVVTNNGGTWGINVTGTAASETLATVTGRGASTSTNLSLTGNVGIGGQFSRSNINHENQNNFHRIAFWDLRFWDWDTGNDIFTLGQGDGNVRVTNSLLIAGNTAWHAGNLTNLNQLSNGPGYITGINGTMVTNALGYTPFNTGSWGGHFFYELSFNSTSTGTRYRVGRVYYNACHWGNYGVMKIKVRSNYYNGGYIEWTISNAPGGATIKTTDHSLHQSGQFNCFLGGAVQQGSYAGCNTFYREIFIELGPYIGVNVDFTWNAQTNIDTNDGGNSQYANFVIYTGGNRTVSNQGITSPNVEYRAPRLIGDVVGVGTDSPVAALSVVGKTNLGSQNSGFYVPSSTLHIASTTVSQISFEDYIITAAIAVANNTFAFGHQNSSPSYEFRHSNTFNGNYATTGTIFARFNPSTSYISSGNFGIGTASPSNRLSVEGGTFKLNHDSAAANYYLWVNKANSQDGGILLSRDNAMDWQIVNNTNTGNLGFYSYGVGDQVITFTRSSGFLGIGTGTPGSRLSVTTASAQGVRIDHTFDQTNLHHNTLWLRANNNGAQEAASIGFTVVNNGGDHHRANIAATGDSGLVGGNLALYTRRNDNAQDQIGIYINNIGNVGVGYFTTDFRLDVNGTIRATADVIAFSDARVKENVQTVEDALNKVTSLRGVTYTRKDIDDKSIKMGVIAQEVLAVIPEVVQKDNNGNYSVAYGNMVGVLIEAIKEQQAQIEDLKNQITELKENK